MQSNNKLPLILNKRILDPKIINQYIAEKPTKEIDYNIYLPAETSRNTSKNLKAAIDEIAYCDTRSILKNIIELLNQLNGELKEKNPFTDLLLPCKQLYEKQNIPVDDYVRLIDLLTDRGLPLAKQELFLKKNSQKINHNALQIADPLFKVWLPGLQLHACIQRDRKIAQAVIFATKSTRSVAHPIPEAQMQVSAQDAQAINEISVYEAEQALPSILSILYEVQALVGSDSSMEKTVESINYAIKILSDANEKLYLSASEIPGVLGKIKSQIIPDLNQLVEKLAHCRVNETILLHIQELIVWLEGLYAHSYNPPHKSFFKKKLEQMKEMAFKTTTGLSKKDIANFYHLGANGLRSCIQNYEKELEEKKNQPNKPQSPMDETVTEEKKEEEMPTNHVVQDSPHEINRESTKEINSVEECITFKLANDLELSVKVSNAALLEQIQQLNTEENLILLRNFFTGQTRNLRSESDEIIQDPHVAKTEYEFWCLLNEVKNSSLQVKIDTLLNTIRRLELSNEQKNRLLYLKEKAAASLEGYKNDTYFKAYLHSLSDKIFPRANVDVADEALSNLNKTSFDDSADDPKTILLELFNSRKKLLEKKRSHTLLPCIEELLREAYEHLMNKTPVLLAEKQANQKQTYGQSPTLFSKHSHAKENEVKELKRQVRL